MLAKLTASWTCLEILVQWACDGAQKCVLTCLPCIADCHELLENTARLISSVKAGIVPIPSIFVSITFVSITYYIDTFVSIHLYLLHLHTFVSITCIYYRYNRYIVSITSITFVSITSITIDTFVSITYPSAVPACVDRKTGGRKRENDMWNEHGFCSAVYWVCGVASWELKFNAKGIIYLPA